MPVTAPVPTPEPATQQPPANSHADEVNAAVAARLKKLSMATSYRELIGICVLYLTFAATVTSPTANRDADNSGTDAAGKPKGDKQLDAITLELQVRVTSTSVEFSC